MAAELFYYPDIMEEPENKTGLYCFRDLERPCGPDCMSFAAPPDHKDFKGQPWANCIQLVNSHRTGKHLTIIANSMETIRKHIEDQARVGQVPPPAVR